MAPANDLAPMRIVNARHIEPLSGDVAPHVQLRPVADGENADVLARPNPRVVEIPKLRTLILRIPLTKLIAEGKDSLLRPGLLLVPARAADTGVKPKLLDGIKKCHRLMDIAAFIGRLEHNSSLSDRILHGAYDEALAQLRCPVVAECDDYGKVVARIDVQQRKWKARWSERFFGQAQKHDGILAAGKQQRRIPTLCGDFAQNVDGFALQSFQVRKRVTPRMSCSARRMLTFQARRRCSVSV